MSGENDIPGKISAEADDKNDIAMGAKTAKRYHGLNLNLNPSSFNGSLYTTFCRITDTIKGINIYPPRNIREKFTAQIGLPCGPGTFKIHISPIFLRGIKKNVVEYKNVTDKTLTTYIKALLFFIISSCTGYKNILLKLKADYNWFFAD